MDWTYSFCGFVVGALIGLTGMGGGSLMTALLILVFGIHPMSAVGTDLLYAAITKSAGTAVHSKLGQIDWRIVRLLATGSVPTTVLAIYGLSLAPRQSAVLDTLIATTIGVALIFGAVSILFREQLRGYARQRIGQGEESWQIQRLTIALGALLGVLVSVSSVGAGALGVVFLIMLYPSLPAARIVGSDIAHAVPLTLLAGLGHWLIGSVDWHIVLMLLTGSLPGIWAGSRMSAHVPERFLLPLLASVLLVIGSRLVLG